MKTLRRHSPPRPFRMASRAPRTRPEAAAQLVRLEYERDRLMRDLDQIEQRRRQAELALSRINAQARRITDALTDPTKA